MNWLGYWILYVFPALTFYGSWIGMRHPGPLNYFLTPLLAGAIVPFLDIWMGADEENPTPETQQKLLTQKRWLLPLFCYVPVQLGLLLWMSWLVSHQRLSPLDWFGLMLSVGVVNSGIAINVAHELCHRSTALEQALAKTLWFSVGYMHFHIEHRMGHHLRVATPADPATARLGESVYAFWPRSIAGSWRSAWQIERKRLQKQGRSMLSPRNQMLWFALLPLLFAGSLGLLWGPLAALFFVMQCAVAILTLETVNYLEHYGLQRREIKPGKYEKVGVQHSWSSSQLLTNYILLKLQRHADHHANPGRRYQILRSFEDGPQLPLGYGSMILMTLVPPIWHRVMDPRVEALRHADGLLPRPTGTDELRLEDPILS